LKALGLVLLLVTGSTDGCEDKDSDAVQQHAQERLLAEGTAQTGMPAIKNYRERKIAKSVLELRDQEGLSTWTYTYAENSGKKIFLCNSIGYGLPYATQYTSPSKIENPEHTPGIYVMPQADPNGLFSPSSAEGTWVMCKDPHSAAVKPVYIEPRIIVSPFPLDDPEPSELPLTVKGK
jgi:hypothetical protein